MGSRRTDAWEAALTEAQKWQVYDRLCKFPWYEVAKFVAKEFKVAEPSRSSMYRFKTYMRDHESEHRIEQALSVKSNVRKQMVAIGDMDNELEFAWEQLAMESAMKNDLEAGQRYLAMAMKLRDSALEREKLKLKKQAEERAAQELTLQKKKFQRETCELFIKYSKDEKAKQIANQKGVGTDEKIERLGKRIFGEEW